MNQPGKLNTVTPSLRKADSVIASSPASVAAANRNSKDGSAVAISTGRRRADASIESVNISVEKTTRAAAGVFSFQQLMTFLPSWSASFAGHAILLILLTVIATSPLSDKSTISLDGSMLDSAAALDAEDLLIETDLTEINLLKVDVEALNSEASAETADIVRDDGLSVSLLEGTADGIGLEAMARTGLTPLPTTDQGGIAGNEVGTSTQFFGTNATGSRFVFIIDASGSMNEGFRWHQAVRELEKSIDKLNQDQRVLVLLYNLQTFPMFNTPPEDLELVSVTDDFKTRLSKWLGEQVPIGGTRPAHALSYSLTLNPDAIFLLSDGMLADNSIQVLADENEFRETESGDYMKTPIHTVSLGPSAGGAEIMKIIADNNDGEFTWEK